jgi:hypothetical protein
MNHRIYLRCFAALALCALALGSPAQTVEVPRPPAGDTGPLTEYKTFDATHLKDRPYNFNLPKPQYPSSDRVQREFVVEYVYEYALSNYTPEVTLPIVPATQAKRDTPENALIAFFSAMRTGNYDAWLACWNAPDQAKLQQDAKDLKHDATFWKKLWSDAFSKTTTVLVDRVETEHYVILDVRLSGPSPTQLPTVFKYVDGQWMVTNELTNNPVFYKMKPSLAGILNMLPPLPVSALDKGNTQETQAQQDFLDDHTLRDKIVQAGR